MPCLIASPPPPVACPLLRQARVPRVMGMLGAGLLLANVPNSPVDALPSSWGSQMRAAALATIFLRCGLELEFKVPSAGPPRVRVCARAGDR